MNTNEFSPEGDAELGTHPVERASAPPAISWLVLVMLVLTIIASIRISNERDAAQSRLATTESENGWLLIELQGANAEIKRLRAELKKHPASPKWSTGDATPIGEAQPNGEAL